MGPADGEGKRADQDARFRSRLRLEDRAAVKESGVHARDDHIEIAACGLDCGACPIRRMPFDSEAAAEVVAWFKQEGWLKENEGAAEAIERSMYCQGCHGDRSHHWDAECWILKCCVDDKGLKHCSECDTFPCNRLLQWSGQNEGYAKALQLLREMRERPSRRNCCSSR